MAADTALLSRAASRKASPMKLYWPMPSPTPAATLLPVGTMRVEGDWMPSALLSAVSRLAATVSASCGPARFSHALRNTLLDMRADAVGIEAIEHVRDGLQVGNVLLADLPALLDGGDQFSYVGGQLRDALRVKS